MPDGPLTTLQRRTTAERLTDRSPAALEAMLAEAAAFAEHLVRDLRDPAVEDRIACGAGCAWCCHVRVSVSPPEALRIASYLERALAPDLVEELRSRIRDQRSRTHGLDRVGRAATRLPCPLLVDDRCAVHPVRPLRCRGWNAFDDAACRQTHEHPGSATVVVDEAQWDIHRQVATGVQAGLADLGFEAPQLELVAALAIALDSPDAAARWSAGEAVFDGAIAAPSPDEDVAAGRAAR